MKVREPVARPLDVVSAELLLSASQAFLVGVLMYLAIGIWDDRGVGFGPVAVILVLLGAAIGGSWLYWLLGGVGWPLAAADAPTAMFLGFALLLGWQGDDLFRVEGVPALLALAAAIYGIVCGVFLDSPRRWRWDQRQKPRPGTTVPRVSPTTRALLAQVPRSLPGHAPTPVRPADLGAPWMEQPTVASGAVGIPYLTGEGPTAMPGVAVEPRDGLEPEALPGAGVPPPGATLSPAAGSSDVVGADTAVPAMPTERLERLARSEDAEIAAEAPHQAPQDEPAAIELPTSLEPKAQRSPWAWAAPPEWNREEDDAPPRGRSSGRS